LGIAPLNESGFKTAEGLEDGFWSAVISNFSAFLRPCAKYSLCLSLAGNILQQSGKLFLNLTGTNL